ncbi:cation diffusion facilitator family transporter [candidate division KSB1 bacterium]|nr:cation diffusion facilitator family transporter [candidate division KSB1 bacterium]
MEKVTSQLRRGQRVALWASIATLFIAVLKGVIGTIFQSRVLVADAFHSAADTIAIVASAFGLWLASRKKSKRFPYGLFKAETFVTFIIGALIAWAGIELLIDGYHKLFTVPMVAEFPVLPVIVTVLSIIAAFFIARVEKRVGREINSRSLIANAGESFLDIITSVVVLLGILMAYWQIPIVEGLIIMLISLLIFKLGLENLWQSLLILLDANLDADLQDDIEHAVIEISGVKFVNDVKIRQSGPFRMVELKFTTNPSISIYQAHAISDEIEQLIHDEFQNIESVFVHAEPSHNDEVKAIVPVSDINGMHSKIYGHFGRAPYFAILKIKPGDVQLEDFYLNEFLDRKHHIGLKVVNVIVQYDLDMLFTNRIGEISFHVLKDNYIDIYQIDDENLSISEVIDLYQQNKLQRIITPTHSVEESLIEAELS